MDPKNFISAYDFTGKTIAITGGGGVLCGEMARGLAGCGANLVVLDRDVGFAEKVLATLKGTKGSHKAAFIDVLDKAAVQQAADKVIAEYGKIDGLINGAGGNNPKATTNPEQSFFDIPPEAIQFVANLNLQGTILPSQAFGRCMVKQKEGVILNVSSMNAFRPLTRIPAYSAAKAAVSNFTQWLAVHLAQEYSPNIRVNAIAPGFFLTEQNRFLLTDKESGALTARGHKIMDHTPMARFGTPEDLVGAVLWLLSPASNFVTGIVLPIDGGFSAYSGV
ncbi:MAG: SDR family oxidoreductase [Polyangia bacterium]|jgi:NAD(P)-dependent dehydrogenase (short-subunit alcohol dehydrogenase family)